jgi:hypothetical protein
MIESFACGQPAPKESDRMVTGFRLAGGILVAAAFVLFPAAGFAQEVGVKAGLNSGWLTPLEDETPDITHRRGPVGGVWVRTPLTRGLSFQAEGLFSEKGSHWDFPGFASWAYRVRYFEVPLLARADFGAPASTTRMFAVAGAAPAFKLSARTTVGFEGQTVTRDTPDAFYSVDVGLVGGAGVEIGRAQVEARYTHGLRHINTDDNGEGDRVRNRVFSVLLGFRIR